MLQHHEWLGVTTTYVLSRTRLKENVHGSKQKSRCDHYCDVANSCSDRSSALNKSLLRRGSARNRAAELQPARLVVVLRRGSAEVAAGDRVGAARLPGVALPA